MNFVIARRQMVERFVKAKGVSDPRVLEAMRQVPRHLFVEEALRDQAYGEYPLPIGEKQTISHPFMVGRMSEALCLCGGEKILEIGTGSGYQSAVLAQLGARVFSIERFVSLARRARRILDSIGAGNVNIRVGDGTCGWEEQAPFDGIIVTAGTPAVPPCYFYQLALGGRMVIPVGPPSKQVLKRFIRTAEQKFEEEVLLDCRFVPLVGRFGWGEDKED